MTKSVMCIIPIRKHSPSIAVCFDMGHVINTGLADKLMSEYGCYEPAHILWRGNNCTSACEVIEKHGLVLLPFIIEVMIRYGLIRRETSMVAVIGLR